MGWKEEKKFVITVVLLLAIMSSNECRKILTGKMRNYYTILIKREVAPAGREEICKRIEIVIYYILIIIESKCVVCRHCQLSSVISLSDLYPEAVNE